MILLMATRNPAITNQLGLVVYLIVYKVLYVQGGDRQISACHQQYLFCLVASMLTSFHRLNSYMGHRFM